MNEQEIREALIEWETHSANKENKVLYEARLKYLRDELSNIRGERRAGFEEGFKEGYKEGFEIGRKIGITKGRHILIQNMAEKGLDIPEISRVTGFSEEEVQEMIMDQQK